MAVCTFKQGTVMAEGVDEASATVCALPMAAWWDIDIFPIAAPALPGDAS